MTTRSSHLPSPADERSLSQALACVLGPDASGVLLEAHSALDPAPPLAALSTDQGDPGLAFLDALNRMGRDAPLGDLRLADAESVDPATEDLPSRPITLVIFPGVFGEFIDDRAFGGVFSADSALRREWHSKLRDAPRERTVDASYDLMRLAEVERPLVDLAALGSIDGPDGQPVVRVILLQTPRFSLESIGSLDDLSPIFARRLEKVCDVLGEVPPNLVLVGYSMGSPVALDVLSRAQGRPWTDEVCGVVSLAGVNYGSTAADAVLEPGSTEPAAEQLQQIRETTRSLEITRGSLRARARNYKRWAKFGLERRKGKPAEAGPRPDASKLGLTDARSLVGLLLSVLKTFTPAVGRTKRVLPDFDANHDLNVRRWQMLVERALGAIGNLTTQSRLDWWREHTVPADLTYYALPAVFADPEINRAIATNTRTVEPGSVDYVTNLGTYRDYVSAGGTLLNDGQVGLHQVRFWPELIEALNPEQELIQEELLGVLAGHHWSPALATGVSGKSPFPREALLQAIALKIGWDLESRRGPPCPAVEELLAERGRPLTAAGDTSPRWEASRRLQVLAVERTRRQRVSQAILGGGAAVFRAVTRRLRLRGE